MLAHEIERLASAALLRQSVHRLVGTAARRARRTALPVLGATWPPRRGGLGVALSGTLD